MSGDTFDMPAQALLGPALDSQTPESFRPYVMELTALSTWKRADAKKPRAAPRPTHVIEERLNSKGTPYGICKLCGARSRSTKTKCRKTPLKQEIATDGTSLATECP